MFVGKKSHYFLCFSLVHASNSVKYNLDVFSSPLCLRLVLVLVLRDT